MTGAQSVPFPKIDDDRLLDRLTEVFRVHGYEGASLSRISKATGLKRGSLYHRFPGGKDEMAQAVLKRADDWFASHVLAPLAEPGDPAARVRKVADRLKRFYFGGDRSCLLDTLSLGEPGTPLREHVEQSISAWLDEFAGIAGEAGHTGAAARRRAEDALVRIQGSLVLARATGGTKPLGRVLKDLTAILIDPAGH